MVFTRVFSHAGEKARTHGLLLGATWFIFCAHASIMPHLTRYYDLDLGLSDRQIGFLMAVPALLTMVMQPVWGLIADRWLGRTNAYRLGLILGGLFLLAFTAAYEVGGYFMLMACAGLMYASFMSNGPLLTSIVLSYLGRGRSHDFAKIRVWGSVSFAFTIFFVCPAVAAWSGWMGWHPRTAVFLGGAMFILATLCCTVWDENHFDPREKPPLKSFITLLRNKTLVGLYLATLFGSAGFSAGFQYLGPYLGYRGYSEWFYSATWLIGVSAEVILSLYLARLIRSVGLKRIIVLGFLADSLRWFGFGWFPATGTLLALSVMHGPLIVGLYYSASIYLDAECQPSVRSTAQTMIFLSIFAGQITGYLGGSAIVSALSETMPRDLAIQAGFGWFGFGGLAAALIGQWIMKPEPPRVSTPRLPMDEMAC